MVATAPPHARRARLHALRTYPSTHVTKSLARGGAALALAAVLVGGGWLIAHRIPWHGRAVRLWSEEDLPPLPNERDNGWVLANRAAASVARDMLPRSLDDALGNPDWSRLKALDGPIREFAEDPAVRDLDAAAQVAFGAPRFADACAIALDAVCRHRELAQLHDLAAIGVLANALGGRWDVAFERAKTLLRADLDLMQTSRSALSALYVRRSVRRDLDLIRGILDGVESDAPHSLIGHEGLLSDVASLLEPPAEPTADGRRAVVTEYIYVTGLVRTIARAAASNDRGLQVNALLLDEERTIMLANPCFLALERFAQSPSTREPPPVPRYSRNGFGWWAYNPAGKLALDAAMLDHAPAIRAMSEQRNDITASAEALRERLRATLARLPSGRQKGIGDAR